MAILEIKKFNNPILRKKSTEVKEITEEIKTLVKDMTQTMRKARGVGLAAVQVGVLKRIITIQLDPTKPEIFALINPKIIKESKEKDLKEEGCLSFPNIFIKVRRAEKVEAEAIDLNGHEINIKAMGLAAQVLQHEIDHMDGKLFFQRLTPIKKLKFKIEHPRIKTWI